MSEETAKTVTGSSLADTFLSLSILAAVCFIGAICWKGCQGQNERSMEYVKQGYTELQNGVWVKLAPTAPPSPAK